MTRAALTLLLLASAAWPSIGHADSFRCGTRLITEGSTMGEVAARCGEPADVQRREILRRPVHWIDGRPYYLSYEPEPVVVEYWLYNLGPNKLMRRIKFEDGVVTGIETLEHGYR